MPSALGHCWPCHVEGRGFVDATLMIDGDPLCATCARIATPIEPKAAAEEATQQAIQSATAQRAAKPQRVCSRGCGRPAHRGRCAGAAMATVGDAAITLNCQEPPEQALTAMDTLIFEVVDDSAVPTILAQPRCTGRLGKLWSELTRLGSGKWLKVPNRDRIHAMNTARHTGTKAKKAQRKLETRVDGSTLYCRLEAR